MKKVFTPTSYTSLLGLDGFSDALLSDHFALYEGYVKNSSLLAEKIAIAAESETYSPEVAELKRRFAWEYNGMRLHELYFENLTKTESDPSAALTEFIRTHFGSLEAFKSELKKTGTMRGIGWVLLAYDKNLGNAFITWIDQHDTGHLAGTMPLLVMDVFEHAYIRDYGLKRADYIDAFLRHIDFSVVEKRLP